METTMTIEQVNDLLKNYEKGELVKEITEDDDLEMRWEIRSTNLEGVFMQVGYVKDSYGETEYLHSLKLVKPVTKTVTDYE